MKRKLLIGFVLVLIVLSCSLAALASEGSYVVQYCFGENTDSPEAHAMEAQVLPLDIVHQSGSIVCTVKDAYFDGETLAIGIGFQTDRPFYLVSDDVKLNGEWAEWRTFSGSLSDTFIGSVASPQNFPITEKITGVSYELSRPFPKGETVEVLLRYTMLTPRNGVEEVDMWQEDKPAMWAAIDAAYEKGLTPISAHEPHKDPSMVLITRAQHDKYCCEVTEDYHGVVGDAAVLVEYANMDVLDTVEVVFSLTVQ